MLSLTAVRMIPVAIAMLGTGARRQTVGFLGWFGPRGLASIVFAVLLIESHGTLPGESVILDAVFTTIALSVLLHGLTAAPLAKRYSRWFAAHPEREALRVSRPSRAARSAGGSTRRLRGVSANRQAPERGGLVLVALILVAAVANLNLAVANVALPSIGDHFDSGQTTLDLIAVGYSLGLACSVLWLGALGDRYGRKLMLLAGRCWRSRSPSWPRSRPPTSFSSSHASAAGSPPGWPIRRRSH